jgi:hypothetical protein
MIGIKGCSEIVYFDNATLTCSPFSQIGVVPDTQLCLSPVHMDVRVSTIDAASKENRLQNSKESI